MEQDEALRLLRLDIEERKRRVAIAMIDHVREMQRPDKQKDDAADRVRSALLRGGW